MKNLFRVVTITILSIGITLGFYGCKGREPEDYLLKVVNKTNMEFKQIGLANENIQIVGAVVGKNIKKDDAIYFFNKNIKNGEEFVIKAVGKDDKVYECDTEINSKELNLKDIKENKLISNNNIEKTVDIDFDILSLVDKWDYKVVDGLVESSFLNENIHSTSVMGAGGKLGYSEDVAPTELAEASWEIGKVNYSWIEIKTNR